MNKQENIFTQIQIRKELKEQLKKIKITSRETYDEIIERLLKNEV